MTYIINIRTLNHNKLKKYLENKLLSIDPLDIIHTIFFKKLYVLLLNLPDYLKELDLDINESKEDFVNFWTDFFGNDNTYFYEARGFVRINSIKLTNNNYLISIPLNTKEKVILNIHINYEVN